MPKLSILNFWQGSEYADVLISTHYLVEQPSAKYRIRHTQNIAMFRTLSIIVNSDIFRYFHVLFRHIEPCRNPVYLLHIQKLAIFRILAYLEREIYSEQRHIPAYSERCVTISYWEPCLIWELYHIHSFGIFRTRGIIRTLSSI